MSSLSKDPNERPQTAFAFASSLRGQAEGIGALYRRAFSLYSEYFPKFVKLSIIAHLPVIAVAALMIGVLVADKMLDPVGRLQKAAMISITIFVGLLQVAAYFVAAGVISVCDRHHCYATLCGSAQASEASRCVCCVAETLETVFENNGPRHDQDHLWLHSVFYTRHRNVDSVRPLCAGGLD
jgi:hypothetical protein